MTHNGTQTLSIGDAGGPFEPGYQADLVLIEGDLVADPAAIKIVKLVIKNSLAYDPAKLTANIKGAFRPG